MATIGKKCPKCQEVVWCVCHDAHTHGIIGGRGDTRIRVDGETSVHPRPNHQLGVQESALDGDLHFDYEVQAWVRDGKYLRCGHTNTQTCRCYGRIHEGETEAEARSNESR